MGSGEVRSYTVEARSTDTFGRILCNARNHYVVIDGPHQNGCPNEAVLPSEQFLSSVAACGAGVAHVIAKAEGIDVGPVHCSVTSFIDYGNPVRADLTVFNRVDMRFEFSSVSDEQARFLADRVGRWCPLYGSVAASAAEFNVEVVAA